VDGWDGGRYLALMIVSMNGIPIIREIFRDVPGQAAAGRFSGLIFAISLAAGECCAS
jgi:hypothetical protein